MNDETLPAEIGSSARLGPVGWRYVPSDIWGEYVLTQDPEKAQLARDVGRAVEPLYTEAQLTAAVAVERERWNALRAWAEQSRKEHEAGQMMSIAESIHGAAAMRDVLQQMAKLQGPNVELSR